MNQIKSLDEWELTTSSGVDFDDPDYGFKEEDKDPEKVSNHNRDIRYFLMV